MPAPIDDIIKKRVVQQWLGGEARDKIAAENNLGAGTVTSIVSNYKVGLETVDFDSIRQLALEIRKQGFNWSHLSSHFRLYNFIGNLGASQDEIETFIPTLVLPRSAPKRLLRL
jgi:hypothetical protein